MLVSKTETDPLGRDAHTPGAKLDAGKPRPALVLGGFARALTEVTRVGTYGAVKYTEYGWTEVPNGVDRYDDAMLRHWLDEKSGKPVDPDTDLMHAAHAAWNALARLDLLLRQREGAGTIDPAKIITTARVSDFEITKDMAPRYAPTCCHNVTGFCSMCEQDRRAQNVWRPAK